MSPSIANRYRVRDLNDAFRAGGNSLDGQWVMTRGVADKGAEFIAQAAKSVRQFSDFTGENDPYGEHDFGAFDLAGERLFWRIDCYDRSLNFGSPDPADPSVTRRVLTLMLASEY